MERPANREAVRLGARIVLAGVVFVASGFLTLSGLAFVAVESPSRAAPRAPGRRAGSSSPPSRSTRWRP